MIFLTAAETRTVLRIDQKTLLKIISSGALPAIKAGVDQKSHYRISAADLAKYSGLKEQDIIDFLNREHAEAAS